MLTQEYNKKCGQFRGSGSWISQNDDNGAMISTSQTYARGNFRRSNQNSINIRQHRFCGRGDYQNNNNTRYKDYKATSPYQPDRGQSRNWGSNSNHSRLPSIPRQGSIFTEFSRQTQLN